MSNTDDIKGRAKKACRGPHGQRRSEVPRPGRSGQGKAKDVIDDAADKITGRD